MPRTPASPTLDAAVTATLDGHRAGGGVPGLAVAVADGEGLLIGRSAGMADVAAGRAVERDTLFEIGSIGKTFTALVILQLVGEGRLALDDPIARHLPWFRVPRTGERITIHHLLSHTAGITAGIDGTPEATFQVWRLRELRPGSAPGRRFHYSNVGYKALGLVIEAIEGRPYRDVLRDRLLDPLGLTSTEPAITDAIRDRLAVGYQPARTEVPWQSGAPVAPAPWLTTGTADGSLAATAEDLVEFARRLMIDPDGPVATMSRPVPALGAFGYGYGLVRRTVDGRVYVGHGGGMVGYLSGMLWDVEAGIAAVVLQNGMAGNPNALARRLIRQVRAARAGADPREERVEVVPDDDSAGAAATVPVDPGDEGRRRIVGTYVSHQPWTPSFRVEARADGRSWLVFSEAPDGFDDEQPLVATAGGWFRVGVDRLGPERLRFDTVIEGLARRAWLSGWDYYRTDP